jgi:hypothetical protein
MAKNPIEQCTRQLTVNLILRRYFQFLTDSDQRPALYSATTSHLS